MNKKGFLSLYLIVLSVLLDFRIVFYYFSLQSYQTQYS